MERIFIYDYPSDRPNIVQTSLEYAANNGCTMAMTCLKSNWEGVFDDKFKHMQDYCTRIGITLAWKSRYRVPWSGGLLLVYPTRELIEEADSHDDLSKLIVLGWAENDYDWWLEKYGKDVTKLELRTENL